VSWFAPRSPTRPAGPRVLLGRAGNRLLPQDVALAGLDVHRHKHIIGNSGFGKSKLVESLVIQDLQHGIPVCVVDPTSDLIRSIGRTLLGSGFFASKAGQRFRFVNFGSKDAFVPFNILALHPPFGPKDRARHVNEACKRIWPKLAEGQAPQFENIMAAAVMVLVYNQLPLPAIERLLTDKPYREALLANVPDRQTVAFFHSRFDRWGREAPGMIESTLRRIFLLTFPDALRFTLGQATNVLNFRALMDSKTSLFVGLGGVDEETQRVLGALITVGFEEAAFSREDIPERERHPYHLYIDEFSLFSAPSEQSLARVLSLTRKYGLTLHLVHQTWSQLSERLQGALQNCIHIAFNAGPEDAVTTARLFTLFDPYQVKHTVRDEQAEGRTHPVFLSAAEQQLVTATQLMQLERQQAFIRVGSQSRRFRTLTVPEPAASWAQWQAVEAQYARSLGTPRAVVMRLVDGPNDGSASDESPPGAAGPVTPPPPPFTPRIEPVPDDEAPS